MELRVEADLSRAVGDIRRVEVATMRALERGADDASTLTLREVQLYPPQRPPANPRKPYKRTQMLKSSWRKLAIRRVGNQVIGEVVSSGQIAPYNVWVQKADMQATIHRSTWTNTDRGVIERLRGTVARMYEERLRRALGSLVR